MFWAQFRDVIVRLDDFNFHLVAKREKVLAKVSQHWTWQDGTDQGKWKAAARKILWSGIRAP